MAAGYLLDTKVISETRKSRADAGVVAFVSAANAAGLFLSVLTLGELRNGVAAMRRSDPAAADRIGAWVDGIETMFADRLLPVGAETARRWAELSAGRSLPVVDDAPSGFPSRGSGALSAPNDRSLRFALPS